MKIISYSGYSPPRAIPHKKSAKTKAKAVPAAPPVKISMFALFIFFVGGMLFGALYCLSTSEEVFSTMRLQIAQFFSADNLALQNLNINYMPEAFWNTFQYVLVMLVFGMTPAGVVVIPAAAALKGFFVSITITSCIRALGISGAGLALAAFGLHSVLIFFSIYLAGIDAMSTSIARLSGECECPAFPISGFAPRTYVYTGLCVACALLEVFVSPFILRLALTLV